MGMTREGDLLGTAIGAEGNAQQDTNGSCEKIPKGEDLEGHGGCVVRGVNYEALTKGVRGDNSRIVPIAISPSYPMTPLYSAEDAVPECSTASHKV